MSSVSYLNVDDFVLFGQKKKSLGLRIPGVCVVFFKLPSCNECREFENHFFTVAQSMRNVSFFLCSIDGQNRVIASMSNETTSPILSVPEVLMYSEGQPILRFSGRKDSNNFFAFINHGLQEASKRQVGNQAFAAQHQVQGGRAMMPPAYQNQPAFTNPPMRRGTAPVMSDGLYGASQTPSNMPALGTVPNLGSAIKGYQTLGSGNEDDEQYHLNIPQTITPHNTPWEATYRTIGT